MARADEPGSGRVSPARSQHQPAKTGVSALMSFDALCARAFGVAALAARHSASKTRVNALIAHQRGARRRARFRASVLLEWPRWLLASGALVDQRGEVGLVIRPGAMLRSLDFVPDVRINGRKFRIAVRS
jgi:hypothetical protein